MSCHSIYPRAERDHPSTVISVNFEHMAPCSSVSTVDFEHVFIFWVWSFNISIVFRLRWIQVPFIYRKDFYEVKHLHEVACKAPCLFFFRNLFKISKLECVNSPLFRTPSINYSGVIFQGKISFGVKSPGVNCPEGSFMGVTCPWGNCPWGKLFRGNYPEGKSLKGNFPGGNFIGGSCPVSSCPGGNTQG